MEGQLVELTEEEEVKEADLEMVRYRRQARVEGAHPDVGSIQCLGRTRPRGVEKKRMLGSFLRGMGDLSGDLLLHRPRHSA